MNASRNISIIGAGAIGGWLAARLALDGHRVEAIGSRGPVDRLTVVERDERVEARFAALGAAPDILIIAVKTTALAAALPTIAGRIGPQTLVIPAINGVPWWFTDEPLDAVDPGGAVAAAVPPAQVIGCVVHASATRDEDATVRVNHVDRLILGEPRGGPSGRVTHLCGLFESAGVAAAPSDQIRADCWYKLWGNATTNPISALTRATCDQILASAGCRAIQRDGMTELALIGTAIGCAISETPDERMDVTARLGAFKTSMLQDLEARRPLELDALLGAPIEIARREGIATPTLDRLYALADLLRRNA